MNHQPSPITHQLPPELPVATPMPKESPKAFSAFQTFLELGPNRTLADCAQLTSVSLHTVRYWSAKFKWPSRVRAYSAEIMRQQMATATAEQVQATADWSRRVSGFRELEWETGQELMAIARSLLARMQLLEPNKVSLADVTRALEVASKISRVAADIPPSREESIGAPTRPLTIEITAALDKIYGPKNVTPPKPTLEA